MNNTTEDSVLQSDEEATGEEAIHEMSTPIWIAFAIVGINFIFVLMSATQLNNKSEMIRSLKSVAVRKPDSLMSVWLPICLFHNVLFRGAQLAIEANIFLANDENLFWINLGHIFTMSLPFSFLLWKVANVKYAVYIEKAKENHLAQLFAKKQNLSAKQKYENLMNELNNAEKEKLEEDRFRESLEQGYRKYSNRMTVALFLFAIFWTLLAYLLFSHVWIPTQDDFSVLDMRYDMAMAGVYYILLIMSLCQIRSFSDPMSMLTELNTMLAWLGIALVIYSWYLFSDYLLSFTNYEIRTIWDSVFWTFFYIILASIQYQYIYISLGYEPTNIFELFCCQCKLFYWGYNKIDYDLIALDTAAQHNLKIFRNEMFGRRKRKKHEKLVAKQSEMDERRFSTNSERDSLLFSESPQNSDDESSSDDVESIESLEDTKELLDIANGSFKHDQRPEMCLKYLLTFRSGFAIFLDFLKTESRESDLLYMLEYSQFIEMRYSYLIKRQENVNFEKIEIPYLIQSWLPRNGDYSELTMKEHALSIYDKFIKVKCKFPLRLSQSSQDICHPQFAKLRKQLTKNDANAKDVKNNHTNKKFMDPYAAIATNNISDLVNSDMPLLKFGNNNNKTEKEIDSVSGFDIMGVDYAGIFEGVMKDVWKEMNDSYARFIASYDPKGLDIALQKEDNAQGQFFMLKIQAFYYA